jgi:hypothetical protein
LRLCAAKRMTKRSGTGEIIAVILDRALGIVKRSVVNAPEATARSDQIESGLKLVENGVFSSRTLTRVSSLISCVLSLVADSISRTFAFTVLTRAYLGFEHE